MKFIGGFVLHTISNAVAFLFAAHFVKGFSLSGTIIELAIATALFTAMNAILRPILKLFLGPFIVLTLGFFTVIVNAFMLYLLDIVSEHITIQGYLPLLYATVLVSAVNFFFNLAGRWFYKR